MFTRIIMTMLGAAIGVAVAAVLHRVRCSKGSLKLMEEIRLAQASIDSKMQEIREGISEGLEHPQQQYSCWVVVFKGVETGRIYTKCASGYLDAAQAEWDCRKEAQDELEKLEDMEMLKQEHLVWPEPQ